MFRLYMFFTALLGLVALAAVLAVIALALVRPLVILVLSAGCETFPALRTPVRVPTCRTKKTVNWQMPIPAKEGKYFKHREHPSQYFTMERASFQPITSRTAEGLWTTNAMLLSHSGSLLNFR